MESREHASLHEIARVLVVDDELEHAEICAALLRRRGYAVAVAINGTDALELARILKPDLILLDLFMPMVDGFSTAASLQEHADTAKVPIVFFSACGDAAPPAQGRFGPTAFLQKPFRAHELLACVEQSLSRLRPR
jgi:CheY-like chemotaxis protein